MKIKVAENTGFCMGVRKAVLNIVNKINNDTETIYVYGPLIHNPQTIAILQSRGLITIDSLENIKGKTVAIRTHGIPRESLQILKQDALQIINLTCPRVARVQGLVKKYSRDGYFIIIIGDDHHAEVESVKSYANSGVAVIASIQDIQSIEKADKYIVVAQTTFDEFLFEKITKQLKAKFENILIFNTICDSTHKRQNDVIKAINEGIDTLIVVGGKNSANTKRLASLGKNSDIKTFHIETEEELLDKDFKDSKYVLVTAGASTPGWIINNVLEKLYAISTKYINPLLQIIIHFLEIATRLNIISSLASFFMTLLIEHLTGIWSDYKLPSISSLFIFIMYAVNNYFLKDTLKIANPFKYRIHNNNHYIILISTITAITASIIISYNIKSFAYTLIFYSILIAGMVFSTKQMQIIVDKFLPAFIQKIYAIKTIPANIGWITISLLLPIVYSFEISSLEIASNISSFSLIIFLSYIIISRNLLLDLIGFGGDLIFGNITLPILFGLENIKKFFIIFSLLSIVPVMYLSVYNNILYLLFILNIVYYYILFNKIIKLTYFISLKYEILTDTNFILLIILISVILSI